MSGPVSSVTGFPSVTSADLNAHTIQALVELVYCQTANDVLTSAMSQLQQALATTQNVLRTLTRIQNLKNSLQPVAKSSFSTNFDYNQGSEDFEANYNSAASAFFGTPIDPAFYIGSTAIVSTGSPGYLSFIQQISRYKGELSVELAYLSTITDVTDPNTLYATLKVVFEDMPQDYDFSTVQAWVLDNYNVHGAEGVMVAGNLQQHLTDAITAGQSLNSSQQQKVQNYLFIFQQYYQSAAAVLSAIEQIINRMAQAAGR